MNLSWTEVGGTAGCCEFFALFALLNMSLAIFNLIPLPPLDGSRILSIFLPQKAYFGMMKYERYISLVLMLLLVFGVLSPVFDFFTNKIINVLFMLFNI